MPNWFKACRMIFAGAAEGRNKKVKLAPRKTYGIRTF
jgi:hypothetical protein